MTHQGFHVRRDDLDHPRTRGLLALHLAGMHANSPPNSVFALDLSGLQAAEVTVWSAWSEASADAAIASIGALKMLPDGNGEVKSMRTHPDFVRRGAATAILETIIAEARTRGATRLSLETGRGDAFEPALGMYRQRGFKDGGPFSDYRPNAFSQFLHLDL